MPIQEHAFHHALNRFLIALHGLQDRPGLKYFAPLLLNVGHQMQAAEIESSARGGLAQRRSHFPKQ